jgi:N-acetylmuramoyl-L-alanine amidase
MGDKVIYLSPSAQEYNIGYGDFGSEEYRMNRIADIVEKLLKEQGYTVYRNDPNERLSQIVRESNEINPDIHVALHSNASGEGFSAQGPEIFANRPNTPGDRLANQIYNEIMQVYPDPTKGRGVLYTSSLYEIIRTNAPAVLLEVAFHDNPEDAQWIIDNESQIAQAIVSGINSYFSS